MVDRDDEKTQILSDMADLGAEDELEDDKTQLMSDSASEIDDDDMDDDKTQLMSDSASEIDDDDMDDDKTQLMSDSVSEIDDDEPAPQSMTDTYEDAEKTRMIDPSILEEELSSSRLEKVGSTSKSTKAPEAKATKAPEAKVAKATEPKAPPPQPAVPPPAPPPPPPPTANKKSAQAPPPADQDNKFMEDSSVPKLRFPPKYLETDLRKKPLNELKKMLNDAEGRMTLHENTLFQLEEIQGEKFKSDTHDPKNVQEINDLFEKRDIEREKMRTALVDVQMVSEALVRSFNIREAKEMGLTLDEYIDRKNKDFQLTVMPWYYPKGDLPRIWVANTIGLIVGIIVAFYIPSIDVPPKIISKNVIPDRLASIVLERKKKPPPPPPPILRPKPKDKPVEKEVKKKEEVKKPEKKRIKRPPKPKKPETEKRAKAREKAKQTGLLKNASALQNLAAGSAIAKLGATAGISTGGSKSVQKSRRLLTTKAGSGSGGIKVDTARRSTGGVASNLGKGQSGVVSGLDVASFEEAKERELAGNKGGLGRSDEEIQIVFDQNQASLYRLYQRELRKNPSLRGKIVFKITIDETGKVTKCSVYSSDLNSPKLEKRLVLRIKAMRFPAKPGSEPVTFNYPIDFLPT